MGFTKNKGFSVTIITIIFVIFNIVTFLLQFVNTINFWLSYCFATFSILLLLFATFLVLGENGLKAKFLSFPIAKIAWVYLVLQLAFAFWQMENPLFSYQLALIGNSGLLGLFLILAITAFIGKDEIAKIDEKNAIKVFHIKNLQADIELMKTTDKDLLKTLGDLAESIQFSDPISYSGLATVENKIENKIELLKEKLNNTGAALALCDEIQQLIKERNSKAKLLKGVPEPQSSVDNTGVKVVGVTFSIISVLAAVVLIICFSIIPLNKYNTAIKFYNDGEYEQAKIVFENLGNFRDSVERIELTEEKIKDEKYMKAEGEYKDEHYVEAIAIYTELGDYKDSKKRIDQIYNMWANGEDIYFGSYKGKPVAWIVLERNDREMLLIAKEPVIQLAMNDELKNVDWNDSSLKKWLNNDFLSDFSDDQKEKIIKSTDKVFLLSESEFNNYSEIFDRKSTSDWWLSTKTDSGFMFIDGSGKINTDGESVVRAKGIRPAIWINLK